MTTNEFQIAEYTPTAAALADFRARFDAVVFDVGTGKGMTQAKEARAELRTTRIALEAKRVEIKAPALERCRLIDAEAKRITAELTALEEPIDSQIKAEELRKADEKAAKDRADAERLRVQGEWFESVRNMPLLAMNKSAAFIGELIAKAEAVDVDAAPVAPDMVGAANFTKQNTINALKAARDARLADDERQAQIERDLAELNERRRVEETERAERERVTEEQRRQAQVAAEARDREERETRAREQAEREAKERAERDAEQARMAAERADLERQRKEAADAAAAEQKRLTAERAKLEAERKAAAKKARDSEIANATLHTAASGALALLRELGHGEHLVTLKLASALSREGQKEAA